MAAANSHRDLVVWRKGIELAVVVTEMTERFPKSEMYGLTSPMQRAAISIPANFAEGNARKSRKEYAHFVSVARGSAVESETLIEIAIRIEAEFGVRLRKFFVPRSQFPVPSSLFPSGGHRGR